MATHPDMIWQFSRFLQKRFAQEGMVNIEIYAYGGVTVNGGDRKPMVDPEVNLLSVDWNYFGHNTWILTENDHQESLD